jgi:uncharacterized membrane protein YphA (DoxX/SURF4 family)
MGRDMQDNKQSPGSRAIVYWVATAIAALLFAVPGTALIAHVPHFADEMARLGYPGYFLSLLGIFKVLAAVAILVPGFARLKEWAYAGMMFDIVGAIVSHAAVGDEVAKMVIPVVIAGMVITSWSLRPKGRTLVSTDSVRGASQNTHAMERAR